MEKLVMCYTSSAGYGQYNENTIPFEYASVEDSVVDFEKVINLNKDCSRIWFAGREFMTWEFIIEGKFVLPNFYTLEEWFENFKE